MVHSFQLNSFKYHTTYRDFWSGVVIAQPKWHRDGTRPRKGPYNKSREMTRRVKQMVA